VDAGAAVQPVLEGRAKQLVHRGRQPDERFLRGVDLRGELGRALEPAWRLLEVRRVEGHHAAHRVPGRESFDRDRVAGQREGVGGQLGTLGLHAAQPPVPAERAGQPDGGLTVAGRDRAADRGMKVLLVIGQQPQPVQLLRGEQVIPGLVRELKEVRGVCRP